MMLHTTLIHDEVEDWQGQYETGYQPVRATRRAPRVSDAEYAAAAWDVLAGGEFPDPDPQRVEEIIQTAPTWTPREPKPRRVTCAGCSLRDKPDLATGRRDRGWDAIRGIWYCPTCFTEKERANAFWEGQRLARARLQTEFAQQLLRSQQEENEEATMKLLGLLREARRLGWTA